MTTLKGARASPDPSSRLSSKMEDAMSLLILTDKGYTVTFKDVFIHTLTVQSVEKCAMLVPLDHTTAICQNMNNNLWLKLLKVMGLVAIWAKLDGRIYL